MFKLTPPLVNWPSPDCDDDREDGFTLIEILVVIIIIGILAAVAIPIFLNQQKAARDSQTTSDTRNAATALETGMVYDTTAKTYRAFADENGVQEYENGVVPEDVREFWVQVGSGPMTQSVKTEGTHLKVGNDDIDGDGAVDAGAFRIDAWNGGGLEWGDETNTLVYRNALGGIQSTSGSAGESSGPGGESEGPGGEETETDFSSYDYWLTQLKHNEANGSGVSAWTSFPEGTSVTSTLDLLGHNQSSWDSVLAPSGALVEYAVQLRIFDPSASAPEWETFATGESVVSSNGNWTATYALPARPAVPEDFQVHIDVSVTKITFPDGSSQTAASHPEGLLDGEDVASTPWGATEFEVYPPSE